MNEFIEALFSGLTGDEFLESGEAPLWRVLLRIVLGLGFIGVGIWWFASR
jgi:hypothetical protein